MNNEYYKQIINDFYNLCNSNRLNVNYDLFDKMPEFCLQYPEVKTYFCDNETFSNSLLVAIPLGPSRVALFFLDQHNSEVVRINFSYQRFVNFTEGMQEFKEKLVPSSKG